MTIKTLSPEMIEAPLINFLNSHNIGYVQHRHAPVFTVEEAQALRGNIPGGHAKCLFVRDKKKRRGLIVAAEERPVDLGIAANALGFSRLSFGSAETLYKILGVRPGSVTPFALLNAQIQDQIQVQNQSDLAPALSILIDQTLMAFDTVNFHPLHNASTLTIKSRDLLKFIQACGYKPILHKFN